MVVQRTLPSRVRVRVVEPPYVLFLLFARRSHRRPNAAHKHTHTHRQWRQRRGRRGGLGHVIQHALIRRASRIADANHVTSEVPWFRALSQGIAHVRRTRRTSDWLLDDDGDDIDRSLRDGELDESSAAVLADVEALQQDHRCDGDALCVSSRRPLYHDTHTHTHSYTSRSRRHASSPQERKTRAIARDMSTSLLFGSRGALRMSQ